MLTLYQFDPRLVIGVLAFLAGGCVIGIYEILRSKREIAEIYEAWRESAKKRHDEAVAFAIDQFETGFRAGHMKALREGQWQSMTAFLAVDHATRGASEN